ncbi:MAG: DUF3419 family protein [Bacteroidia bacterium]|nr:DUF3419 family protein [Bacteroidia bacterium]
MPADFFSTLVYAAANEDSRSELRALHSGPQDRILCLTGSGARPLDLLTAPGGELTALDLNPAQTRLLHLKAAAIAQLDAPALHRFLGIAGGTDRMAAYRRLRASLPPDTAAWWDRHPHHLRRGVLYAGIWEHYLALMAQAGALRGSLRRRLFDAPDLDTQARIWEREWEGPLWTAYLRFLAQRWLWRYALREPGIDLIPPDADLAAILHRRFGDFARRCLLRESDFAVLLFWGQYQPEYALPLHLRPESLDAVRRGLPRLRAVTASLEDWLPGQPPASVQGFSLSDFASYAGPEPYRRIWAGVLHAAAPGARFCERQFLAVQDLPPGLGSRIRTDAALSAELTASDRSFIYTIRAGVIHPRDH